MKIGCKYLATVFSLERPTKYSSHVFLSICWLFYGQSAFYTL